MLISEVRQFPASARYTSVSGDRAEDSRSWSLRLGKVRSSRTDLGDARRDAIDLGHGYAFVSFAQHQVPVSLALASIHMVLTGLRRDDRLPWGALSWKPLQIEHTLATRAIAQRISELGFLPEKRQGFRAVLVDPKSRMV